MGGSKGGGGGGDFDDYLNTLWLMENAPATKMARNVFEETAPARTGIIDRGTRFLGGDLDPTQSPMYGPGKSALESSYGTARDNIIANMPSGGAMTGAMTDLEMGRAGGLGDLSSRIAQDEYDKIYGLATGAPQTAISGTSGVSGAGVGGASNIASARLAGQATNQSGKYGALGDLGMGTGMFLGNK